MMHKRFFIVLIIMFCCPMNLIYGMDTGADGGHIDIDAGILLAVKNNRVDELESMLGTNNFITERALHAANIALEMYGKKSPMHQLLLDYILAYRAYRYDQNLFTQLLADGANINTTINDNQPLIIYTITFLSAYPGWTDWFKYLIEHGADVNSVDTKGASSLAILCTMKDLPLEAVMLLLKHGANPNVLIGQTNPEPLLHWAIKNLKADLVRELLKHGADMDKPDESGQTAFDICYAHPRHSIEARHANEHIKLLLFIKKVSPENNTDLIWQYTHAALEKFASEVARGKDLTILAPCLRNSHLCGSLCGLWSYSKTHPIEVLINSITGSSLSHRLMIYGYMEIFLTHGKNGTLTPLNPWTNIVAGRGAYCIAEHAIKLKDEQLFALCAKHHLFNTYINDFVEYSIPGRKADTTTFLHLCVQHNFPAGIKMICDACNNKMIDTADKEGRTPLAYALALGHTECATILLNHRCNPGDATTIELAKTNCPEAVVLLKNAQGFRDTIDPITLKPITQGPIAIADLPADVLKHIFAHTVENYSLKDRMTFLKNTPMKVSKAWKAALTHAPLLLLDCAATYAQFSPHEINKMLYHVLVEWGNDQNNPRLMALFHYLARLDINSLKSEQFSLLDRAIGDYNIEAVKIIIDWYEKYDQQAKIANPNHVPLINQPNCFRWSFSNCAPGTANNNRGMTSLGYAFFMLKTAQHQWQHNTKLLFSALNCINYLLEHGANPDIAIPAKDACPFLPLDNPIPLPVIALLEHLECAIPLLIGHGIDVNRIYSLGSYNPRTLSPSNPLNHTLLTFAANRRNKEAIETLLKIDGIEINKVVNGMTALDVANWTVNSHEIITLLTNAGAKGAQPAANNNPPAGPQIQNPPAPTAGNLAGAHQDNALPHNNVAHIANNNPDPAPGNTTQIHAVNWLSKKPMYWIAGVGVCAAGIYAWYKNRYAQENDTEDGDEDTQDITRIQTTPCTAEKP